MPLRVLVPRVILEVGVLGLGARLGQGGLGSSRFGGNDRQDSPLPPVTDPRDAAPAAVDPESSWQRFLVALESDIGDIQGGTTREGIHVGVMAGTLDLVQRAYLGTEIRDDVLYFDPKITDRLDGLRMPMQFRRAPITVSLAGDELTVAALADGYSGAIKVGVGDTVRELRGGESTSFAVGGLAPRAAKAGRA